MMDFSGSFESESALKYISPCDEVTHDNKPLKAGSIVPLPARPSLFSVWCRKRFLIFSRIGRSVGRIEKKKNRKKKKNYRKSLNRRPDTPASLLWSLETTRHELKRIWQKRWLMLL